MATSKSAGLRGWGPGQADLRSTGAGKDGFWRGEIVVVKRLVGCFTVVLFFLGGGGGLAGWFWS